MADCIFNGTVKRPPMGLAEVTLTLVDPELAEAARKVLGDPEPVVCRVSCRARRGISPRGARAGRRKNPSSIPMPKRRRKAKCVHSARSAPRSSQPHTHPGEVVIGRRLYRSGQSEYLINGRPARLRDIQDLFMGIGLGPDSYAIIEQGRIGQVLSSKPSDRRAIIEEAAGITKYKTKKRLAEAKLESSQASTWRA